MAGCRNLMDVLNLWNDDPEELLLELGFGCDEPDLSARIPARFINYPSQARGINLQVFLGAQKTRLDLENPDVSNRFREVEVLQHVTTALCSLVVSSSSTSFRPPLEKHRSPEARERRRRIGSLYRRASKRSLIQSQKTQDLTTPTSTCSQNTASESLPSAPSVGDRETILHSGCQETLSPPEEEQGAGLEPNVRSHPLHSVVAEEQQSGPDSQSQSPSFVDPNSVSERLQPGPQENAGPPTEEQGAGLDPRLRSNVVSSTVAEEPNPSQEEVLPDLSRGATGYKRNEMPASSSSSPPHLLSPPQIPSGLGDGEVALEGVKPGCQENVVPPAEEQGAGLDPQIWPQQVSSGGQEREVNPLSQAEERPLAANTIYKVSHKPTDNQEKEMPDSPSSSSQRNSSSHLFPPRPSSSGFDDSHFSSPRPLECESSRSEVETPQEQLQPHLDSSSKRGHIPPCSYSPELQNLLNSQRLTQASAASSTPLVPSATSVQAASLCGASQEMSATDKDDPYTCLSTLQPDSEDIAWTTFSSINQSIISPSPSPDLQCPSSVRFDSSIQSPGDAQPEWTEMALMSFPHFTSLTLSIPLDFAFKSILSTSPPTEASRNPDNRSQDSDGIDIFGNEQDETPTSGSFQLSLPLTPSPPPLVSGFEDGCPTLTQISHEMSNPDCTSAKPTGSNPDQIDSATGRIVDFREQVSSQQAESLLHNENRHMTSSPPSVQDVSQTEVDERSWDMGRSFHGNRMGGDGIHPDTVQTEDTERSADLTLRSRSACHGDQTEPDLSSCSPQEELGKVCLMESGVVLDEPVDLNKNNRSEAEINSSAENEDVDLVFETSVDGLEGDSADVEAFFRQLDDEGRVYWAEPVRILTPSLELKASGSFEVSGGYHEHHHTPDSPKDNASDLFPTMESERKWSNPAASSDASSSPDLQLSSRSVSVQMSSSPSSHIVHRKDVPYVDDSKCSSPPRPVFPLDTSNPLRAVQAWTDAQIQRHIQKSSRGARPVGPDETPKPSQLTRSSTLTFSSSPSSPLTSHDTLSRARSPGMARNDRTVSASVDTGLWSDKEEEADGGGYKDERHLWEGEESVSMTCCCSCDRQGCSAQRGRTRGDTPLSLDDLEEMMLCLQHFRSVHRNMEERLCEDRASVYAALSDHDREMIQDLEVLRRAVKQETAELEAHLNDLAHHYDDSLKMKMHRLLDEQSLLYSHLSLPGAPSGHAHRRTVATQCRLPSPEVRRGHAPSWSRWNMDTPPTGSESSSKGLGRCTEPAQS